MSVGIKDVLDVLKLEARLDDVFYHPLDIMLSGGIYQEVALL